MKEPAAETEFEVQAWLWNELRALGFNVRGEVGVRMDVKSRKNKQVCRFDLAHFVDGNLAGIIEVKRAKVTHKTEGGWAATRQGQRYKTFGVPVRIVYGQAGALNLREFAAKHGSLWEAAR